jgi:hypothetical protein
MRDLRKDDVMFAGGDVCGVHGDEHVQECTLCGSEFCRLCCPGTVTCPDCGGGDEADPEEESEDPEPAVLPPEDFVPDPADR